MASHRSAGDIAVGAEAFVTEMVSPQMSVGGEVAARWIERSGGPLGRSVGIAVMYVPEDFAQPSNEIAIRFTGLSLYACPFRLGISSMFDIQPCAFGVGGWLTANDRKVSHPTPVVRSFVSAGALARAGLSMGGRVTFELQAGVSMPLFPRRFVTTVPDKVVGETPILSPIIGLGLAYALF